MKRAEKNTRGLWDRVWRDPGTREEDIFTLAKEENCIRWQRIEKVILDEFGSFDNLKVLEIGAGSGTNAALAARRGARVTVMDYSEGALKRARDFFERNGLSAEFLEQNALSLSSDFCGRYDVSMSFGLTEHFRGQERTNVNRVHFEVLRRGGIAFIAAPNKYNPPYRIFKFGAGHSRLWKVGEEHPYSRREFATLCREIGVTHYRFFGDSLIASLRFVNPYRLAKKAFGLKGNMDISRIRKEKGTFLDQYLSYSLVLCGKKE